LALGDNAGQRMSSAHLSYGIATFNSRIPCCRTELHPHISGAHPWNNLRYQKPRYMRGTNARTTPTRRRVAEAFCSTGTATKISLATVQMRNLVALTSRIAGGTDDSWIPGRISARASRRS
jgi:hypothetical protein